MCRVCVIRKKLNVVHVWCSVTCDTQQDAEARIAATGATGGLVGKRDVELEQRCASYRCSTWVSIGI